MGELAISRALGDIRFKDPQYNLVIPTPEVTKYTVGGTLILACDGIYDVLNHNAIRDFIVYFLFAPIFIFRKEKKMFMKLVRYQNLLQLFSDILF